MWQWLNQNSPALGLALSLGMLGVWAFYLNLFVRGYRRERRCKILISLGGQQDLTARCLITNMSAEPVYVENVTATVSLEEEEWSCSVSEYGWSRDDNSPMRPEFRTRQGPLLSGQWRDIGSISDVLERARDMLGQTPQVGGGERPFDVELLVVAIYDSEDLPVGAKRRFTVVSDGAGWRVSPSSGDTEQIRGRRARHKLKTA